MKNLSKQEFIDGIQAGNTIVLSKAITLLESTKVEHNILAREILESVLHLTGNSHRIGITGVPGVGKSTFIESLGLHLTTGGQKLAVLAIDPSSQLSKGSILGDKTRMENLSKQPGVFIRPSAAGDSLGGVGRKTRETIMLCEAAGFQRILIETVGVGQSEVSVHSMVDCFLLLLLPNAGDELQGIKRGIMEMAEIILVNKAYDENQNITLSSKKTIQELNHALHYFPDKEFSWITKVAGMDALHQTNMQKAFSLLDEFFHYQKVKGNFTEKRNRQQLFWYHESIKNALWQHFYQKETIKNKIKEQEAQILAGSLSSFEAADQLLKLL